MAVRVNDSSGQPVVPQTYRDHAQVVKVVFDLKTRGLVQFGERPQEDGSTLAGFAVQLRKRLFRVLVFRGLEGGYTVADDFMASASGIDEEISGVRQVGGTLVYTGYNEQQLLARPVVEGGGVG